MTCVVVKATVLVREGVVEAVDRPLLERAVELVDSALLAEVVDSVDRPLLDGNVLVGPIEFPEVWEALSELLLFFDARIPPTPPATAAPMTTNIPTTMIIQNALGTSPQIRRCDDIELHACLCESRWRCVGLGLVVSCSRPSW